MSVGGCSCELGGIDSGLDLQAVPFVNSRGRGTEAETVVDEQSEIDSGGLNAVYCGTSSNNEIAVELINTRDWVELVVGGEQQLVRDEPGLGGVFEGGAVTSTSGDNDCGDERSSEVLVHSCVKKFLLIMIIPNTYINKN